MDQLMKNEKLNVYDLALYNSHKFPILYFTYKNLVILLGCQNNQLVYKHLSNKE